MDRQSPVNGLNQHTASGASSLSYDARGNLTNNGSVTFGYDIDNRLTSSSSGATMAYDALDRISQVTNASGTVTKFLYDGDDLIAEYDGSGVMQHRYVHGPGVDEPLVSYPGSGTAAKNYLVADQEGSIIAQTDIAGQWQSTDTYDEYGNPGSTNTGRFQYTGQVWLPEFGVYSYKARDYAPGLGVFLQTDPIGYAGGMNLYAYVGDDPVNFTDAFGLCEGQGTRTPCVGGSSEPDDVEDLGGGRYRGCSGYTYGDASKGEHGAGDCFFFFEPQVSLASAPRAFGSGAGALGPNTVSELSVIGRRSSTFACAAAVADSYSLAGLFGWDDSEKHPIANALLGNTFSGIHDFWRDFTNLRGRSVVRDMALGGMGQGVPIRGALSVGTAGGVWKGGAGLATDAAARLAASGGTKAAAAAFADTVGAAKFGVDAIVWGVAYLGCRSR